MRTCPKRVNTSLTLQRYKNSAIYQIDSGVFFILAWFLLQNPVGKRV